MKPFDVILDGRNIRLDSKCYLSQGGQGVIYLKNNCIFKIYHDPKLLIPEMKIDELQVLSDMNNIIIPTKSLYKGHTRVGFVMEYVHDTEFLCKIFSGNFKTNNNITPQMVVDIIKFQQDTVQGVHDRGVIFGDYNEMNQLLSADFKIPYHIDMDSVQTKSFKCNAIMESVRDRQLPFGEFNEGSDWFSWAVVTFQMYCGINPYKGTHPKFKKSEWSKRMDANISVFDKDVNVPKFVDFSVIPTNHLEWYKQVFINGDRSIPPAPTGVSNIKVIKKIYVDDKSSVTANLLFKYDGNILDVVYRNGTYFVLTSDGVYYDDRKRITFDNEIDNGHLLFTPNNDVVIATKVGDEFKIFDGHKTQISKLTSGKYYIFNNCIYLIDKSGLIQYSFERIGKIKCLPRVISNVSYNSAKIYEGVVLQDIFGKYSALIPYEINMCKRIDILELSGCRILDAKRLGRWMFVVYEKAGKFCCLSLYFDKEFKSYKANVEEHVDFKNINAMIKENNMVVFNKDDNTLELCYDMSQSKVMENTPVYNDLELVSGKATCFMNGKELYSLEAKKSNGNQY